MDTKLIDGLKDWRVWIVTGYTVAALSWSMPEGRFPFKTQVNSVVTRGMFFLSLVQRWDMFAPDPRNEDIFIEVFYKNRDGSEHRIPLSRMPLLGYVERMQRERWRKYFNDHAQFEHNKELWRPLVEFVARRLRDEGQDPANIKLIRWWRPASYPVHPNLRADLRVDPWLNLTFYNWDPEEESESSGQKEAP